MSGAAIVVIAVLAGICLVLAVLLWQRSAASPAGLAAPADAERIVFPYGRNGPTPAALDAALRLARATSATLVPVFLARVSLQVSLDAPLPRTAATVIERQELIERRAAASGVPVDQRVERGRSYRHAMRKMIAHERFDRIVVAASATTGHGGFDADDIAWLLRNAPGEIFVLRTAPEVVSPQEQEDVTSSR